MDLYTNLYAAQYIANRMHAAARNARHETKREHQTKLNCL